MLPTRDSCVLCTLSGQYLNSVSKTCETCSVISCKSCSPASTCTECLSGKYLLRPEKATCVECNQDGQFISGIECVANCQTNCRVCESATSCLTCKTGFYRKADGTCDACFSDCEVCTSITSCSKCKADLYLMQPSSSSCVACNSNGQFKTSGKPNHSL